MCDDTIDEIHARILEDGYQLCLKMLHDDDDKNSNIVKCLMEGAPMHRNIITLALQHRMETGGVFDRFISAKALKFVETLSIMDTETVELMIGDFIKLFVVTAETFENAEVYREFRRRNIPEAPPRVDCIGYVADPNKQYYISDFVGGEMRYFELGERLVDTYLEDDFFTRNELYKDIVKYQEKMKIADLNDDYLRSILPADQFEAYLMIKIRYLHEISCGDTYDKGMFSIISFEAEATAIRAYLTSVLRLIFARGHTYNEPIPKRLRDEIYEYYPRSEDPNGDGKFWKYTIETRAKAEAFMNIPNRYTELDDD